MSSSSATARVGAFTGLLAVLAIPAAVVAAQVLNGIVLLRALYVGVAVAVVLALIALLLGRRARLAQARRVDDRGAGARRLRRAAAGAVATSGDARYPLSGCVRDRQQSPRSADAPRSGLRPGRARDEDSRQVPARPGGRAVRAAARRDVRQGLPAQL